MKQHFSRVIRVAALVLAGTISAPATPGMAQGVSSPLWSPQQTIPGYGSETNPPILVDDGNGTVHAFASQRVGDDESILAITYNQWTPENGWTKPNDVLLSPIKQQARLLDVFLDDQGVFHVVFFGGDEVESYLFYAKAHAAFADEAPAWTLPEAIATSATPPSAAIVGDNEGNMTVLSTGSQEDSGVFAIYSNDRGETWSEPSPVGPTYSDKLSPFNIQMAYDAEGKLHAVWQLVNIGGQGRGIFYANRGPEDESWTEPVDLSEGEEMLDYGTNTPALVVHDGTLFVLYNVRGKIVMTRSQDTGQTWNREVELFRHVGVNGLLSLVEDGGNSLHLFFGQRITGNPDIHGMWHSVWRGSVWSEPDPIVSGPAVADMSGDTAFDPYDASAVAVRGNEFVVTWRSDPGLTGNGVWFANRQINAPATTLRPLPTPSATPIVMPMVTRAAVQSAPTGMPPQVNSRTPGRQITAEQPMTTVVAGLLPVFLFLVAMLARSRRSTNPR